ncbi:MAG TPA: NUDIX domain-containing protein [Candidatus Tectomicrobia bacterium]|nr:NUDIX domain-containing protein [Candidatus Tectomicrobia bacterium]
MSHYAVPVKPPAAVPAPAATLVLLRDDPAEGLQVLLMRRHEKSRFAAGDFAFPGGKLHPGDDPEDAAAWCVGVDGAQAARTLGLDDPRQALACWIGAIRETFEEVGVLLATDARGGAPRLDPARAMEYRRACQQDNRAFWTMVKAEGLRLATDRLVYFAHWITPEDQPLRFDTRFFAAAAPADQEPALDGREVTAIRWITPRGAMAALARREITARPVTVRNLALFAEATSAAAALARLRGRRVATVRPRAVVVNGERKILLPGDPGYDG